MTISKVIEILLKVQKEVGDVDVLISNDDDYYAEPVIAYSVKTTHTEMRDTHELTSTTVVILKT